MQEVELFATNYTIGDTDQTYLYGITDVLGDLTAQAGESFATLETAPADTTFKGVAFAPSSAVPEPSTWAMMLLGFVGLGFAARRLRKRRLRARLPEPAIRLAGGRPPPDRRPGWLCRFSGLSQRDLEGGL